MVSASAATRQSEKTLDWKSGAWSSSSGFSCVTLGKSPTSLGISCLTCETKSGVLVSIAQNWLINRITRKAYLKLQTRSSHYITPVQPANLESLSSQLIQDPPSLGITGLGDY